MGDLMRAIDDPCMLAVDMWSKGLISDGLKEEALTLGLSDAVKKDKLLSNFHKTLCLKNGVETKPLMIKFCDVLKNQRTDTLDCIITKIMEESQIV